MENVKMNMNNIDEELNIMTNNMITNFIMDKLGELKGMDAVVDYTGDINYFCIIRDVHIAAIKCIDGLIHYLNLYGKGENEEDTEITINVDNIKGINGEVHGDWCGDVDIILQSGVVSIEYE